MHLERLLEAIGYQEMMHWNRQFTGQAGHADKTTGGLEYKRSGNGRKLLSWLVLEGIVVTKKCRYKKVCLFSNNTATVL